MFYINWLLTIIGPIIVYFIERLIRKKNNLRKIFAITSISFILLFVIFNISDTYFKVSAANDLLFSMTYLGIVFIFWTSLRIKNVVLKVPVIITLAILILSVALLGITGLFGITYNEYYASKFEYDKTYNTYEGYSIQLTKLGHALEPDGIQIHVFKDIEIIPIKKKVYEEKDYSFYGDLEDVFFSVSDNIIKLEYRNDKGEYIFEKEIMINSN